VSAVDVRARLAVALALVAVGACECVVGPPPPPSDAVGAITTRAVAGGFELVLDDLKQPLRAVQVDVTLDGARATAIGPAGAVAHDVLEAGLDQPASSFTAVVSDARRLPLVEGAIARIEVDGAGAPSLSAAVAVDDDGRRRSLTLVVP
jgi:hypothetical protein